MHLHDTGKQEPNLYRMREHICFSDMGRGKLANHISTPRLEHLDVVAPDAKWKPLGILVLEIALVQCRVSNTEV